MLILYSSFTRMGRASRLLFANTFIAPTLSRKEIVWKSSSAMPTLYDTSLVGLYFEKATLKMPGSCCLFLWFLLFCVFRIRCWTNILNELAIGRVLSRIIGFVNAHQFFFLGLICLRYGLCGVLLSSSFLRGIIEILCFKS